MTTWIKPAPPWLREDNLMDLVRALGEKGIVAEASLTSDGMVHVESDADPAAIWAAIAPVKSVMVLADDGDRDVLVAYLALTTPTNVQSVAVIKALIRVVGRLAKQGR